jgi:hypothetical protein
MGNAMDGAASGGNLRLLVTVVPDPESDAEEAERAARQLRRELAELEVDVEFVPADAVPEGAKVGDPVSLTAMVVALSASGGVLATVIGTLRDWLGRRTGKHRVSVTIDGDPIVLEATPDQQQQLIDAYIRRHSAG